jgi:hypothetical protein
MIGMHVRQRDQSNRSPAELPPDAPVRPARPGVNEYVADEIHVEKITRPTAELPDILGDLLHCQSSRLHAAEERQVEILPEAGDTPKAEERGRDMAVFPDFGGHDKLL